jgi:hypothetical protein
MPRTIPRTLTFFVCLLLALIPLFVPATTPVALADTPTPIVTDSVEEWSVGAGLIYWANNCFADEFNPFANLKRRPVGGGTERTLQAINDYAQCITFRNLLATAEGLYYFDESQSRIERMPSGAPFTPQVVKSLSNAQFPSGRPFVAAGDHLYWVTFNTILRTRKNGSGAVETVANATAVANDVLVVGSAVYWTDSTGVWVTSVACDTLPCPASRLAEFASGGGYGLLYQPLGGPQGNYRLYWVQFTSSGQNADFQIRYRACNQIAVCVLSPIPPAPIFYSSTTNWRIGNPVLANNTLYWTEDDNNTISNNNGDIKRRAYNATGAADTIATNQANIDDQLYVANETLFFARQATTIASLPLNATAIVRDFSAVGMEITQGIQNLANSVPLVADKTTYVRAYGTQLSGPSTANVEARLVGTRNGVPLPGSPLQPINGVRALATGGSFDRARLNDGWYFTLPPSWISVGAVSFSFELDARLIHSDPDRNNNTLSQTVSFVRQPPVCVMTVPVRTHTPKPSLYDPNVSAMIDQFKRRWPVPKVLVFRDTNPVEELQVCWAGPFPYPCYGAYELEDGWGITNGIPDRDKVIVSLWTRAQLSFNPDVCDDAGSPVHFMGLVHPDANNGGASGYASTVSNQSWVQLPDHYPNPMSPTWNAMREGSTMAQELAHNHGRKHVDCGNPDDIDSNYPYPPCQIANVGNDSYYGFDVASLQPIRPNQTADFMSYSYRSWVSDYTWRALLNSFAVRNVATMAALPAAAGDSVYVSGLVDTENNRGAINVLLGMPTNSIPPATRQLLAQQAARPQHGDEQHATFKLRLLDAAGATLLERPLNLTPLDDHSSDSAAALWSDMFPQPAGTVATVQLLADDQVIDSRTPGTTAPALAVQQPAAGDTISNTLTIQWTARDPDPNDQLLFTVQYSHDGGTSWYTLALNQPAGPDGVGSLILNELSALQGSAANQARIRVLASDGYNSSVALSSGFTLSNRPPQPLIAYPGAGQTYPAGEPVLLRGSATDAEDGGIEANALNWQVDSQGAGSGEDLLVAGLAPGNHTATLQASDTLSQTGSASVPFAVAPLAVPLASAPTLDGECDDGGYAGASSVPLKAYADGTQARVQFVRSADALWACFVGLQPGAADPGAYVGLRIDADNSRDALAQSSDAGFFVGEDGSVISVAGDGAGGFAAAGPEGVEGQVAASSQTWSAELRIAQAALGGWDKQVSLSAGHYANAAAGDDYVWPYSAVANQPASWAVTTLGSQAVITGLEPASMISASQPFTLTVVGDGFVDGSAVLWNGAPLPTTFVSENELTAQVGAEQLASAGNVTVTTRSPAPGNLVSNGLAFVVTAAPPALTSLTPNRALAGSGSLNLTVEGSNFTAGSQILWNGTPLSTQFVSSTRLTAQIDGSLLAEGQTAGITVRNPLPTEELSSALSFTVDPAYRRYLPMMRR